MSNAGITIIAGKYVGRIGVMDNEPRNGWVRILLAGDTWPVEVRTAHLAPRA
jgi:membrane protein implicated in regulation of membrane protease activity